MHTVTFTQRHNMNSLTQPFVGSKLLNSNDHFASRQGLSGVIAENEPCGKSLPLAEAFAVPAAQSQWRCLTA